MGLFLIGANLGLAKRTAPPEVPPVIHQGVKYAVSHFGFREGRHQNGGYVEAWDLKNNTKLWEIQVYKTQYVPGLETDAQDVFIVSLDLEGDLLLVKDEAGRLYELDLVTREVRLRE